MPFKLPETIDAQWLRDHNACDGMVERFIEVFGGKPVKVNTRNANRAAKAGLSLSWFFDSKLGVFRNYKDIPGGMEFHAKNCPLCNESKERSGAAWMRYAKGWEELTKNAEMDQKAAV